MKHPTEIIKGVMQTEKGLSLQERQNRYLVEVDRAANKAEIKKAIEDFFNVTVLAVNTQNYAGKKRMLRNRRVVQGSDWKRAIVTLKAGERIEAI